MKLQKGFKILFLIVAIFSLTFGIFLINHRSGLQNQLKTAKDNLTQIQETIVPKPTKITQDGLPDYHLIKTAFIPQAPEKLWSEPWQDACEEASLLTVYYYYKNIKPDISQIKQDILNMIDYENIKSYGISINISQIADISSNFLGYQTNIIDNPTVNDIKQYISKDIPVIVPANGKTLYQENKYFSNGGPIYHNIVVLGYDDNKKQFIVHDVGTQHGTNFRYSYNLLMESIHDFPESQNPSDINLGTKRILILLK